MHKKHLYPFFLAATVLLAACQKEVTGIDFPDNTAKLVVSSFISPQDTAVHVRITRSTPTLGYGQPVEQPITNAMVRVSDGTRTADLTFNPQTGTYLVGTDVLPVTAGTTYTLAVTTPDGERAEAACIVPQAFTAPITILLDSAATPYDTRKEYTVRLSWSDPSGEMNYYRGAAQVVREMRQPGGGPVHAQPQTVYWEGQDLISDQGQDGAVLSTTKGNLYGFGGDYTTKIKLEAHLLHTDEPYFRYHRSVSNAANSQENPFAEPAPLYSNISGGLGVFAAYNRTTVVKQLR